MALKVRLLYELLARPLPGEEENHHPLPLEHDPPSSPPSDEYSEALVENPDHPS
jgi:hypothetical protein